MEDSFVNVDWFLLLCTVIHYVNNIKLLLRVITMTENEKVTEKKRFKNRHKI